MSLHADLRLARHTGACAGCRAALFLGERIRGVCLSCVSDFLSDFASAFTLGSIYNFRVRGVRVERKAA